MTFSAPTKHLPLFLAVAGSFMLAVPGTQAASMPTSLTLRAGDYEEQVPHEKFAEWYHLSTELLPKAGYQSEIENQTHCPTDPNLCAFSFPERSRGHFAVNLRSELDPEAAKGALEGIRAAVDQEPANAIFAMNAEKEIVVATPEKLGRALDVAASETLLLKALEAGSDKPVSVNLPTVVTKPKVVAADRERLGLTDLLGEGRTDFKGSPKNRIYNINRSLQQFSGIILAPDEEFSFVKFLGEVDGEHGYLPELVIKNNMTTPEFGGGVCQVSSTVFRAAIYSGMKITERRNHAYPVQYYRPYGMDATIYIPKPDFRFQNNSGGHVLMQWAIEGTTLIFRFYGTSDGRTTTVDGPHILERGGDGSMKTVFTQTVNDKDGQNFIRDSFFSNYKSPALFPHPGEEPVFKEKPKNWSDKQWKEYKKLNP